MNSMKTNDVSRNCVPRIDREDASPRGYLSSIWIPRRKCITAIMLAAICCISIAAFAAAGSTNSPAATDSIAQNIALYANKVKGSNFWDMIGGSAIWDLTKFLGIWSIKLTLAALFLIVVFFVPFSQRLHVHWFITGSLKKSLPHMLGFFRSGTFGVLVDASRTRAYRDFKSPQREKVMKEINGNKGGLFVVMGPASAGKKLLVYAKSKAPFVLAIDWKDWYDRDTKESPVKDILQERTELLVKHLIWTMPVCIVLEWKSGHPAPDYYRLKEIVRQLAEILEKDNKSSSVSFVLVVPAYYQLETIKSEIEPQQLPVNLLDCSECICLLDAEIEHQKARNRTASGECRRNLEALAKKLGLSLGRMVWIGSFGMPEYVVKIVGKQQYDSPETWRALLDWWEQVYAPENKKKWYAYLYVIGMKHIIGQGTVNAEEVAKKQFGDQWEYAVDAVRKMCVQRRPQADAANDAAEGRSTQEERFEPRRVNPEDVLEDTYVIDRLVGSLGIMKDVAKGTAPIFDFMDEMRDAMQTVFNLENAEECEQIATAYLDVAGKTPYLADGLKRQYEFLGTLKRTFGNEDAGARMLAVAYERNLKDPERFQGFVANVIQRQGALPAKLCLQTFTDVNEVLRSNNSTSDYVRLTFELLPAYVIGLWLPIVWGIDFRAVIDELNRPEAEDDVRFMCAGLVYAAYLGITGESPETKAQDNVKKLLEILGPAYREIEMRIGEKSGQWQLLGQMLPFARTLGVESPLPKFNIPNLPHESMLLWLASLCYLMDAHGRVTASDESMRIAHAIHESLHGIDLVGNGHMLIQKCRSRMPCWRYWNLATAEGAASIKKDIEQLKQNLGRWTECPAVAVDDFGSLCDDYREAFRAGIVALANMDELWELMKFIRTCREGMNDICFTYVLEHFAMLIRDISDFGGNVGDGLWNIFATYVKEFFEPILSGAKPVEDPVLINCYLSIYSMLSNVGAVPAEKRVALLKDIAPITNAVLTNIVEYNSGAWHICKCNSTLVPSHLKIMWAAEIMAGRLADYQGTDPAEMIRAAVALINETRHGKARKIDEALVKCLYEENGIAPDMPE